MRTTGDRISQQFQRIEAAEIEERPAVASNVVRLPEERKPGG
jgi:hypothetical protein